MSSAVTLTTVITFKYDDNDREINHIIIYHATCLEVLFYECDYDQIMSY